MKNILSTSILAVLGVVLIAPAAQAAISYNSEDIVVAFSNNPIPNHTGNTYLVDLGNASLFKTGGLYATGNLVTINAGTASGILADLVTAGITGGASRTFSLQGANDTILDTFVSKVEPSPGVASLAYLNSPLVANANNDILTLIFNSGPGAAASTVPNSLIQNTSAAGFNTYGKYVFGADSPTSAYETFGDIEGPLTGVLDLYQITDSSTGTATRLGGFDFNSSTGVIRFSSDITDFAPVPEPSTVGFGLLALGAGFARRQRRAAALVA